jgi:CRISPR system Cascade subunit CasE
MLRRVPPPHIMHGVLSAALPGKRGADAGGCVWRVDKIGDGRALIFVSAGIPDILRIEAETGIRDARNKTLDYEPFLSKVADGQLWNFRLCANPVERKIEVAGTRGKVRALRLMPAQLAWLGRQAEKRGFSVKACAVADDDPKVFTGTDRSADNNTVSFLAVTFEGILTVTDAERFRAALRNGIGREKAYGCGLLTIARLRA